jgi:hypothetical protein
MFVLQWVGSKKKAVLDLLRGQMKECQFSAHPPFVKAATVNLLPNV